MDMPAPGTELHEAVELALAQAALITGRKYRYGAILLAGDDHIPMKQGSNKKLFQRGNIHAEASVLKGCARPEGKDMLIARLAPVRPARDGSDDDSDGDEGRGANAAVAGAASGDAVRKGGKRVLSGDEGARGSAALGTYGKMLNARPCANCEAKMVRRGVRLCYFTLNARQLGVLEYNP